MNEIGMVGSDYTAVVDSDHTSINVIKLRKPSYVGAHLLPCVS